MVTSGNSGTLNSSERNNTGIKKTTSSTPWLRLQTPTSRLEPPFARLSWLGLPQILSSHTPFSPASRSSPSRTDAAWPFRVPQNSGKLASLTSWLGPPRLLLSACTDRAPSLGNCPSCGTRARSPSAWEGCASLGLYLPPREKPAARPCNASFGAFASNSQVRQT